jgi:predicted dehydrogenase
MTKKIGVGVIGASPVNPGWAMVAHIPAIQALPEFELRAVSTSRPDTARAAAEALGVKAFYSAADLINHDGVDLVVVAVKAPLHKALIMSALEARRAVFSEWPLASNLADAQQLVSYAHERKVRTFIGMQARYSPVLARAGGLIAQGYIGGVLATTLVGSAMAWGAKTDAAHAYMFDQANGASTLSVSALHALDAMQCVLGPLKNVAAITAVGRATIEIVDEKRRIAATAPDHISLSGVLASGAVASVHYRGGTSRAGNLRWEINGTDGDLLITSTNGNLQVADLKLEGGRGDAETLSAVPVPAHMANLPETLRTGMGANVAREYMAIARDMADDTHFVPDFSYALSRHRLLAQIEESARLGVNVRLI